MDVAMTRRKQADSVVIKREDLYKEVWLIPILQLARKYDISDVALAKICKKMCIPRPPRGYWAKRSGGYTVRRIPLPRLPENGRDHFILDKSTKQLAELAHQRRVIKEAKQTERQKITRLKAELQAWEMSRRIQAYIAAVQASGRNIAVDQAEFLTWAQRYADHLDPTTDFRIEALDE
jgi:hypothetical protein